MKHRHKTREKDNAFLSFFRKNWWWILLIIVFDASALTWWLANARHPSLSISSSKNFAEDQSDQAWKESQELSSIRSVTPLEYGFPTRQTKLLDVNSSAVYQPTASGHIESALYGSVRSAMRGKQLLPSFHEGIDIAPIKKDSKSRFLDEVFAVAEGRVAYVNRIAGNSNYGIYVVLIHDDPVGEMYTSYSHLAKVDPEIRSGAKLRLGQRLGIMGNTATTSIPRDRSHLHFEIGMIQNRNFTEWYRKNKISPDHGNYHGHNLRGFYPLAIYERLQTESRFSTLEYLQSLKPAFIFAFRTGRQIDYFRRHPSLWQGGAFDGQGIVLSVSEGGVIFSGRNPEHGELAGLGKNSQQVLGVNEELLGRNGLRLIVREGGKWRLGKEGMRWLDILTY